MCKITLYSIELCINTQATFNTHEYTSLVYIDVIFVFAAIYHVQ